MPENAEAGGGLRVAVVQLCIALGSTLGGLLFDSSGYRSTLVASSIVLLVAALLTLLTLTTDHLGLVLPDATDSFWPTPAHRDQQRSANCGPSLRA